MKTVMKRIPVLGRRKLNKSRTVFAVDEISEEEIMAEHMSESAALSISSTDTIKNTVLKCLIFILSSFPLFKYLI
jgi:hypothetical protein